MAHNTMLNNNYLDTKSYTLYLSSSDKMSGSFNNNAIFDIDWSVFLPKEYTQFKVSYSFVSMGGSYTDISLSNYNSCKIVTDFNSRSCSYDSGSKGPSLTLGFAQRDLQLTGVSSNCFTSSLFQYPAKTIFAPTQNSLNIKIYNTGLQGGLLNQLLVNTLSTGVALTDMTNWNMILEFIPIVQSHNNVIQSYRK